MFTTPCASRLPAYPWQNVGSDHFELKGVHYLLVVDYFSHFIAISKMSSTTSASISELKSTFSRYGISSVYVSDNGVWYALQEFKEFCLSYDFQRITNSPYYAKGNALAERMVQTVKGLLNCSDDPYLAMLIHRTTPLPWCGYSPSELLMERKMKTNIPILSEKPTPELPDYNKFRECDKQFKLRQKFNYDHHHAVHSLPVIPDNTKVWITMRVGELQVK